MKTASAKGKGRRFQQEVMRDLIVTFGLDPADVSSRSMGASGTDLLLSVAALRVFPYALECKNTERINVWQAMAQAEDNAGEWTPVVALRRNRTEPLAVLPWSEFLWLAHNARGRAG